MQAIIKNGEIIEPIVDWNSRYFANKLSSYGYSVSFSVNEPKDPMVFGDIKIVPVEDVLPYIDSAIEEFTDPVIEVFENKVVRTYDKKPKSPSPEPEPQAPVDINAPYISESGKTYSTKEVIERKTYENQYLFLTKQIMEIAGLLVEEGSWPKLEDKDYQDVGLKACVNNPAVGGFLVTSLAYVHRTLKTDFEWKWENIQFRQEVVNI